MNAPQTARVFGFIGYFLVGLGFIGCFLVGLGFVMLTGWAMGGTGVVL